MTCLTGYQEVQLFRTHFEHAVLGHLIRLCMSPMDLLLQEHIQLSAGMLQNKSLDLRDLCDMFQLQKVVGFSFK